MANVTITPLPKQVIEEDHRLEKVASGSSVALMKHRWHWTLDEANPRRISVSQYARDVGRTRVPIYRSVTTYELVLSHGMTPQEAGERARMTAEKYEATRAIAQARGISTSTVRETHRDEVRDVRARAQERAERKGTTVDQELPRVAADVVKAELAAARQTQERRKHFGSQYLKADGKFIDAARKMAEGLDTLQDADLPREEWDLLFHTIDKVIELAHLAKTARRKTGDWNKRLEVLRGGLSA